MHQYLNILKFKHLRIYMLRENVVYMHQDCHVFISDGFVALAWTRISNATTSIVTSLNVLNSDILQPDEIGLSDAAVNNLNVSEDNGSYSMVSYK